MALPHFRIRLEPVTEEETLRARCRSRARPQGSIPGRSPPRRKCLAARGLKELTREHTARLVSTGVIRHISNQTRARSQRARFTMILIPSAEHIQGTRFFFFFFLQWASFNLGVLRLHRALTDASRSLLPPGAARHEATAARFSALRTGSSVGLSPLRPRRSHERIEAAARTGSVQSLVIGRLNTESAVLTVTTRVRSSGPG